MQAYCTHRLMLEIFSAFTPIYSSQTFSYPLKSNIILPDFVIYQVKIIVKLI